MSVSHHTGTHELRVEDLCAAYGRGAEPALRGISFSVTCGHAMALVGRNGAGKSTLLSVLAGLLQPSSGSVLWNGVPLLSTRHEVAYLPQRSGIDWSFPITVRGVVELGRFPSLGLLGAAGREDERIVQHALECMQLLPLQERPISQLSGGQQQRAFLARSLAQQAHVLLLDEPFTGLDLPGARALGELLKRMAREEGRLVIAACHDTPEEIARVFDYALLLGGGEQLFFGSCAQLPFSHASSDPSPAVNAFGKRLINRENAIID